MLVTQMKGFPVQDDLVLRARILLNRMSYHTFSESFAEEVESMLREVTNRLETYEEIQREAAAELKHTRGFIRLEHSPRDRKKDG